MPASSAVSSAASTVASAIALSRTSSSSSTSSSLPSLISCTCPRCRKGNGRTISAASQKLLDKMDESIWVHKKAVQILKDAEKEKRDANLQLRALQERVQQRIWEEEGKIRQKRKYRQVPVESKRI